MNTQKLLLAIAAIGLSMTQLAAADIETNVVFKVDHAAPVSQIYTTLESTAIHACQKHLANGVDEAPRHRLHRQCNRDLLNRAVASLDRPDLTAYHAAAKPDRFFAAAFERTDTQ